MAISLMLVAAIFSALFSLAALVPPVESQIPPSSGQQNQNSVRYELQEAKLKIARLGYFSRLITFTVEIRTPHGSMLMFLLWFMKYIFKDIFILTNTSALTCNYKYKQKRCTHTKVHLHVITTFYVPVYC